MKRTGSFLRLLDRLVGVPPLWLMGLVRSRRERPQEIRSIGILKGSGMGDLVLATALVEDLRRAFPEARIIFFCGPSAFPLARVLDSADETVRIPKSNPLQTIQLLRRESLDVLIDLGQWTRYEALCACLGGARYTVGFDTPGQARHYAFDAVASHSGQRHELENFRALVKSLGVEASCAPRIALRKEFQSATPSVELPERSVVFHLWAVPKREWPADRWRELAQYFNRRGYAVALTGSRQSDQERTQAFIESCTWESSCVVDATESRMEGTIRCLEKAKLVISINTGVMHLAAAMNCPLIGMHGPTSSKRWGAVGANYISIDSPCPGAGFLNLGFEYTKENGNLPCMEAITVDEVIQAVEKLLPPSV